MKKLFLVPLTLLLIILLVACNKESDSGKKTDNADQTLKLQYQLRFWKVRTSKLRLLQRKKKGLMKSLKMVMAL